jgi:hypothetical protein
MIPALSTPHTPPEPCAIKDCPNPAVREVVFEQWRGRPKVKIGEQRAWYCAEHADAIEAAK